MNYTDPGWGGQPVVVPCPSDAWYWQVLPDGLIYHSYWAGVHEPRLAIVMEHITDDGSFFDGTLGGRVGVLRYGTGRPHLSPRLAARRRGRRHGAAHAR